MNVCGTVCAGAGMILPDLILPSRANQRWQYSGIDSPEHCLDKKHFDLYPFAIDYQYNNRGFRDHEWPTQLQDLREAIWCIGDSFTVGIGQPFDHIWPQVLSRRSHTRTIAVAMDGASNDWIYRRAKQIQTEISPRLMIVMWSYTHRREHANNEWSDEQRMLFSVRASAEQDFQHWLDLVSKLRDWRGNMIECMIPDFQSLISFTKQPPKSISMQWAAIKDPGWPRCPENLVEFDALPDHILKELNDLHGCYNSMRSLFVSLDIAMRMMNGLDSDSFIPITERLDWARDHHHFDIATSEWLVDKILHRMGSLDFSRKRLLDGSGH